MSLARIMNSVPPPAAPIYAGGISTLREVEKRLKVEIPSCLTEYGEIYGSGSFESGGNFVRIYNPLDPAYEDAIKGDCEIYLSVKESSPEYSPYNCVPMMPGLLPVGDAMGGLSFYLLLDGHPESYTVIYYDHAQFTEFPNTSLLDFIYSFFCNKIEEHPYFAERIEFIPQRLFFQNETDEFP